jgi:uncharacterized membrane protein YcgQ (UPF0703/DUF1980 family)
VAHDHHHGDRNAFYMEQLLTIGVCAAFGGVVLLLWHSGVLKNMLAQKFHIWVFLGGASLLLMALINAVAVWFSVGEAKAVPVGSHEHDHAHCDHDHGDHDHAHHHAHDHAHGGTAVQTAPTALVLAAPVSDCGHEGHDHGWAPWRYAVLLLPVAIYFVVPLDALSSTGGGAVDVDPAAAKAAMNAKSKGDDFSITFQQLSLAAVYSDNRDFYENKTVKLIGQYVPLDDHHFTLRRYKISCCAADAVPLSAVIMADPESKKPLPSGSLQNKWVEAIGRVEFLKRADGDGYATTLILPPDRPLHEVLKEVPPPNNPYLN